MVRTCGVRFIWLTLSTFVKVVLSIQFGSDEKAPLNPSLGLNERKMSEDVIGPI